jgi:hypothetical protein
MSTEEEKKKRFRRKPQRRRATHGGSTRKGHRVSPSDEGRSGSEVSDASTASTSMQTVHNAKQGKTATKKRGFYSKSCSDCAETSPPRPSLPHPPFSSSPLCSTMELLVHGCVAAQHSKTAGAGPQRRGRRRKDHKNTKKNKTPQVAQAPDAHPPSPSPTQTPTQQGRFID